MLWCIIVTKLQFFYTRFTRLWWGFQLLDILGFSKMSNLQKVTRLLFYVFAMFLLSCMISHNYIKLYIKIKLLEPWENQPLLD